MNSRRHATIAMLVASLLLSGCSAPADRPSASSGESQPATSTLQLPEFDSGTRSVSDRSVLRSRRLTHKGSRWEADGVDLVRYGTDGRKIFYRLGWTDDEDAGVVDLLEADSVTARPRDLNLASVPVAERGRFGDWSDAALYGESPDGRLVADAPDDPDPLDNLALVISDSATGATRTVEIPNSSRYLMVAASWFDSRVLVIALSNNHDGERARLMLLDAMTGATSVVADLDPLPGNIAVVLRVVADPSGFAVFDLEANTQYDCAVNLYRCDLATGYITDLHVTAPPEGWDYSPGTGRYVVPFGHTQLEERPLPTL